MSLLAGRQNRLGESVCQAQEAVGETGREHLPRNSI